MKVQIVFGPRFTFSESLMTGTHTRVDRGLYLKKTSGSQTPTRENILMRSYVEFVTPVWIGQLGCLAEREIVRSFTGVPIHTDSLSEGYSCEFLILIFLTFFLGCEDSFSFPPPHKLPNCPTARSVDGGSSQRTPRSMESTRMKISHDQVRIVNCCCILEIIYMVVS